MSLIFECAFYYILIIYGIIPLICLTYALFMFIGGTIARIYYKIEDYLIKENKDD